MDIEKIEQYVEDLLTVSGFCKEGEEHHLWVLLRHLYAAIAMYEQMSEDEKTIIKATQKKLKYFFETNCNLKERGGRKKEKQENTPTPPKEKIEKKEVPDKKNPDPIKRVASLSLEERREAFRLECKTFIQQFPKEEVTKFFFYWSEEGRQDGKMRYETQRYWNTGRRLARWMKNRFTTGDENASLLLENTKKRTKKDVQATEQLQAVAAIREQDNERREREQEQSKQNQELTDDYLKRNPNGLLARWAREKAHPQPLPGGRGVETQAKMSNE